MNTFYCRKFDIAYKNGIYPRDLEKIYNRTKCRKPCSYKKYSLVGEEQPSQIDNGHLLFSLAALQDSIEVQLSLWINIWFHIKRTINAFTSSLVSYQI